MTEKDEMKKQCHQNNAEIIDSDINSKIENGNHTFGIEGLWIKTGAKNYY